MTKATRLRPSVFFTALSKPGLSLSAGVDAKRRRYMSASVVGKGLASKEYRNGPMPPHFAVLLAAGLIVLGIVVFMAVNK